MSQEKDPVYKTSQKLSESFTAVNYMEELVKASGVGREVISNLDKNKNWHEVIQPNTSSIFNKFTVFSYAGLYAGDVYNVSGHFIGHSGDLKSDEDYVAVQTGADFYKSMLLENKIKQAQNTPQKIQDAFLDFKASQADRAKAARRYRETTEGILANPTASKLIKWGAEVSAGTVLGFQPYSHTDFMYCTHYGKIPNNRLVTLRRYPYPISDSLKLSRHDSTRNAIPIAQAVTWFGSETGNDLNKLGLFSWDMPFKGIDVTEQQITGNEVTLADLVNVITDNSIPGGKALGDYLLAAYAALEGSDASIQQISGYEAKFQKYHRELYTIGPYWNRIYGPVNVVHKTHIRDRGVQNTNWQNEISIRFSYKFRSFNGLSPKIAALDLISNFINLTYNDAQFLYQLPRFFPKTGLKFEPTGTEALGKILTNWGTSSVGNNSQQYTEIIENMLKALELGGSKLLSDPWKTLGNGIQTLISMKLINALPGLVSIKSALSDRPVGEWHLVVGNPMNPIFVMGDLLCTNVSMIWDDEMGPDDFPTGVSFQVTLKQGKPRDKTAIERMLNLGQTKLTNGMIRGSTESDTFGEDNNKNWNDVYGPSGQAKAKGTNLEQLKGTILNDPAKRNRYEEFSNRVLRGYGIQQNDKTKLDDSLLLLYYARQYGKN